MMKKFILICLAGALLDTVNAQTFVNTGATVVVTAGGVMSVVTDNTTTGSGSLENIAGTTGILRNAGLIELGGSFVNTSGVADGFGTATGVYRVQGDWENDATFTADNSTVILDGSLQAIKGINAGSPNPTTFYNLIDTESISAANSGNSIKTQEVDALVSNNLTIYASEHATANYYLTVLNADPLAIVQNTVDDAFVSSTGNGRLIRNTNQKAEYIFPTGISEAGAAKIREASITPANTTPRAYSVRFADYTGTTNTTSVDGYDTTKKSGYIKEVNDVYYHLISANGNTDPADLALYFDPAADVVNQSIGRWQGNPVEWQDLQGTSTVSGTNPNGSSNRMKVVKSAWIPTTDTAHALVDTIAVKTDFNFPTAFVGDCATCSGGTASSGNNGVFGIINQANIVTLQELSVFNRWGEMVFDKRRDGTDDWSGHFNGKLAAQGNYVYRAVVINNQTGKQYPLVTGNVALLW